jgi:GMP synthase-like glutamine amidotransferase
MKTVCVIQHTEAEYLGLMEDHFEGRNIRFLYQRPFASGGTIPSETEGFDGLILLGGGPYGVVSGSLLPSLGPEMRLAKAFLDDGLPVIGLGLGALILSVAAGGGADEAPLRFEVRNAVATGPGLLGGHMPDRFPLAFYLRDRPVLPPDAEILAADDAGDPLVFSLRGNCLGFVGHPGMKRGMAEDIIMEFAETPENTVESLESLGAAQAEIAEALSELMVGISLHTGWM